MKKKMNWKWVGIAIVMLVVGVVVGSMLLGQDGTKTKSIRFDTVVPHPGDNSLLDEEATRACNAFASYGIKNCVGHFSTTYDWVRLNQLGICYGKCIDNSIEHTIWVIHCDCEVTI